MSRDRCQICGRRKATRQDGGVVQHYVAGVPCLGVGFPPIEISDDRLDQVARETRARERQLWRDVQAGDRRHAELRLNEPLHPHRYAPAMKASREADRLERRLIRWRARFARAARQMAKYGWSDPV